MAGAMKARSKRRGASQPVGTYVEPAMPVFLLFLGYVLYMYLQGGVRWPMLGHIRFELIMGAVLVPIALAVVARRSHEQERAVARWAYCLLAVMLMMVAFSWFPAYSWDVFWDRGVKFAAYGLFIVAFVTSPRALRWFLVAFLLAFFKMGLEGLIGTITGALVWENQEIPRLHGATPNYEHPNSFSGTQLGVLPFIYYLYPLVPRLWKIMLLVQLALCTNVVLRTGSRTGYLAFLAAVVSFVWLAKSRARAFAVVVLLAVIAVPLLPADYVGRFTSIFEDKSEVGQDTSVGKRKEIIVDASEVFLSHPFGIGVGAFPLVREQLFGRKQDTHNLYLEIATNLGVQGIVVFIGFVSAVWIALARLRRRLERHREELRKLALTGDTAAAHSADVELLLACAKSAWIFLVIRLVLGAFGMDMYEIYWWFLSGLVIALIRLNGVAEQRTLEFAAGAGKELQPSVFDQASRIRPRRWRRAAATEKEAARNS
jgi:O-antigen ligase